MKKFKMELKPNLRQKGHFGKIGRGMFFEPDEKPTVELISNDYEDNVWYYIDRNPINVHEEENGINKKSWRIG